MSSDLNGISTDDLLERLSGSEKEQAGRIVAELVTRHRIIAYRSAMRYSRGNAALADDVFQETFIRLFQWLRRSDEPPPPGSFERLLSTFAKRAAIDLMRKELRHATSSSEAELANVPAMGSATEAWELGEDLDRLMGSLPEKSRSILEMTLNGLSASQIAATLRISEINVRVSRHRAMAALKAQLADDEERSGQL